MKKYSITFKYGESIPFKGIVYQEETIEIEANNDNDVLRMVKALLEGYKNNKVQLIKATIFGNDYTDTFKELLHLNEEGRL